MSLPTTRPRTYVPGMPLIPDDINELFDASIDDKHKAREQGHPAASFSHTGAAGTLNGDNWTGAGAGFTVESGLAYVPIGSRITHVTFGYKRAAAGNVTVELLRKPLTGGAPVVVASHVD